MVKKRVYTVSHVNGHLVFSYDDQGVKQEVVHELPERATAAAQQRDFYRNMPRKERHKIITTML